MRLVLHQRGDVTAGDRSDRIAPPVAAAPERSARLAIGARYRAALVMLFSVAALTALGSFGRRHQIAGRAVDTTRVVLPPQVWRSLLTVTATTERTCPQSVPVVVLYVSRTCPHCMAELDRWAALVRTRAPEVACTGIAVVAAPGGDNPPTDWVPHELTSMLLWDHDAAVAHTLDVRFVPVAAYITSDGVAVTRVVGETSESATALHLVDLRRISTDERGKH